MKRQLNMIRGYVSAFGFIAALKILFAIYSRKSGVAKVFIPGYSSPVFIRRSTSDASVFYQMFVEQEYSYGLDFNPSFIIDGGANTGFSSIYFSKRFPAARVIAIEPDSQNFEMLRRNTRANERIECLNGALWNRTTDLEIFRPEGADSWGFVCRETSEQSEQTVKAYSLNDLLQKFGADEISILKLDIEGAELELFSQNFQPWLSKTRSIMIELHDWMRKGCGESFYHALNGNFKYDKKGEKVIAIRSAASQ